MLDPLMKPDTSPSHLPTFSMSMPVSVVKRRSIAPWSSPLRPELESDSKLLDALVKPSPTFAAPKASQASSGKSAISELSRRAGVSGGAAPRRSRPADEEVASSHAATGRR